ncbi:MAG: hypothetical protein DMD35_19435 [Gemmatimonadetes bacterium]|nr:MAG: hypothetical protein DMD35_19435 [Gemmatimonadota bacterium]
MLIHLSLALLLQAAPRLEPSIGVSHTPIGTPTRSVGSVTEAANNAVLGFLATWRNAWHTSAQQSGYDGDEFRLRDVHCHWDGSFKGAGHHYYTPSVIHHGSRRSMCPNWYPTDEGEKPDERVQRDGALVPEWRTRVHEARAQLLDSLAALAERAPNDPWITGQRVRFLVDQGSATEAVDVARRCSAGAAWCAQLLGFALHAAGDFRGADSAFDAATAALPLKDRCAWTSAELLLDDAGRDAYGHMNCDERIAANTRLWWMARPLFSDSSADRRSEDYARKVMIRLHSALSWDERYDWRERYGSDAVGEMLVRYGWPAFSAYGGDVEQNSHASWMFFYDSTRTATAEYPQDRVHLVPQWNAVSDPFHAPADAWQLNMPQLKEGDEPVMKWWPNEHYAPARGGIVQLSDQTVMLRRDDDVMLATASELRFNGRAIKADTAAAVLVRTTAPGAIERVPRRAMQNPSALVVTAHVPGIPAVVGTEVLAPRGQLSLRTRFGIVPPAPLSALKSGEVAISDPVLLSGVEASNGPEGALGQMLGSTVVRTRKIGLYWETYGYAAGDSVDVALVITRTEKLSAMRRLGMKLHVAHDINGSVVVRWSEPQAGHDSWAIPSRVPIQARAVALDLSQLEPGHYSVQVQAGRRGGLPVTATKEFVLEKW